MKNRNVIVSVAHKSVTKSELLALIEKTFPNDGVPDLGNIAAITITEMTDGTTMQSVTFGKVLDI